MNTQQHQQNGQPMELPRVSVVIPMRNERDYIGRCLKSISEQDYPRHLVEVFVVDGGSTDGSLEIVKAHMSDHPNMRLLGGHGVNCPAAMNVGIKAARGEVIAKVDAHGYTASDYLSVGVNLLASHPDVKCVGGPIRPIARGMIAQAGVFARSSTFGVGRGVYSRKMSPLFVDSVQCGLYRREVFEEIGLFDETLQFGEDEEINWRIRKMGYRILSTPAIRFFYFPRSSFRKLFRQYFNYGKLRVHVIRKHPDFFRPKHAIPAVFLLALFLSGPLGFLYNPLFAVFLGLLLCYFIVSLGVSAAIGANEGPVFTVLLPAAFAMLHFGYGTGFLVSAFLPSSYRHA